VRRRAAAGELDLTVIRPTVIYGPGDQLFMPKLIENLRSGRTRIIGSGQNTVDLVHVSDVVAFLVAALDEPRAIGQTCNLNNPDNPTWQELLETVAVALDVEPPRQHLPYPVALGVAGAMELAAKVTGKPPRLTRYGVRVIGRQYRYPVLAAQELGFVPSVSIEDGVRRCVRAL
jgi:nucleoside-diphosphate-sugar epimerase